MEKRKARFANEDDLSIMRELASRFQSDGNTVPVINYSSAKKKKKNSFARVLDCKYEEMRESKN